MKRTKRKLSEADLDALRRSQCRRGAERAVLYGRSRPDEETRTAQPVETRTAQPVAGSDDHDRDRRSRRSAGEGAAALSVVPASSRFAQAEPGGGRVMRHPAGAPTVRPTGLSARLHGAKSLLAGVRPDYFCRNRVNKHSTPYSTAMMAPNQKTASMTAFTASKKWAPCHIAQRTTPAATSARIGHSSRRLRCRWLIKGSLDQIGIT